MDLLLDGEQRDDGKTTLRTNVPSPPPHLTSARPSLASTARSARWAHVESPSVSPTPFAHSPSPTPSSVVSSSTSSRPILIRVPAKRLSQRVSMLMVDTVGELIAMPHSERRGSRMPLSSVPSRESMSMRGIEPVPYKFADEQELIDAHGRLVLPTPSSVPHRLSGGMSRVSTARRAKKRKRDEGVAGAYDNDKDAQDKGKGGLNEYGNSSGSRGRRSRTGGGNLKSPPSAHKPTPWTGRQWSGKDQTLLEKQFRMYVKLRSERRAFRHPLVK